MLVTSDLIYTCARLFNSMHIQFKYIYIYIYKLYNQNAHAQKYMSFVYKIILPAPFHWTQPPRESGGTHHRITPPTMGSTCFKPSNSSKTSACEASDLDRREDNTNVRITLNLLMKKMNIMMNIKTLAQHHQYIYLVYILFPIWASSLKNERANLLSTFQLLFVPFPVFGTWRCGQSQKTRTLLIRMGFPAGNPDRKILKGTCPPRLVGKWVFSVQHREEMFVAWRAYLYRGVRLVCVYIRLIKDMTQTPWRKNLFKSPGQRKSPEIQGSWYQPERCNIQCSTNANWHTPLSHQAIRCWQLSNQWVFKDSGALSLASL